MGRIRIHGGLLQIFCRGDERKAFFGKITGGGLPAPIFAPGFPLPPLALLSSPTAFIEAIRRLVHTVNTDCTECVFFNAKIRQDRECLLNAVKRPYTYYNYIRVTISIPIL